MQSTVCKLTHTVMTSWRVLVRRWGEGLARVGGYLTAQSGSSSPSQMLLWLKCYLLNAMAIRLPGSFQYGRLWIKDNQAYRISFKSEAGAPTNPINQMIITITVHYPIYILSLSYNQIIILRDQGHQGHQIHQGHQGHPASKGPYWTSWGPFLTIRGTYWTSWGLY